MVPFIPVVKDLSIDSTLNWRVQVSPESEGDCKPIDQYRLKNFLPFKIMLMQFHRFAFKKKVHELFINDMLELSEG